MIFSNGYTITQRFGERQDYYKQFGLNGHEGVDLIPKDNDWDVYCVEDGEVVRDVDNAGSGGAYGITVVILNHQTERAWWYCHLSENYVERKRKVKKGDKIGKMGATGNVTGSHLHLGLRYADENGNATNVSNGYQGFVDPLPVLNELNPTDALTECLRQHTELVTKCNEKDREIEALHQQVQEKEKVISIQSEQLISVREDRDTLVGQVKTMREECVKKEELRAKWYESYNQLKDTYETAKAERASLAKRLTEIETKLMPKNKFCKRLYDFVMNLDEIFYVYGRKDRI